MIRQIESFRPLYGVDGEEIGEGTDKGRISR